MYTPVSVMRTPSVLEENDNREWMWSGSEILLRVGRSRSSVRHNSFLWSLAPLRFVLDVKGNIPYTDGRPLRRSASASVVGMSVRTSFGLGGRENEKSRRKERLWERSSFQSNETSYSVILLRVQRSAGVRLCLASRGII